MSQDIVRSSVLPAGFKLIVERLPSGHLQTGWVDADMYETSIHGKAIYLEKFAQELGVLFRNTYRLPAHNGFNTIVDQGGAHLRFMLRTVEPVTTLLDSSLAKAIEKSSSIIEDDILSPEEQKVIQQMREQKRLQAQPMQRILGDSRGFIDV